MARAARKGKGYGLVNQLPLFAPQVEWNPTPPSEWPDFARSEYLGVDTETHDPHLATRGPGFVRGDAHVIGVSLADENGRKIYLPVGHVEDNYDPDQVKRYLKVQLSRAEQRKVGANLTYDLEALWSMGLDMPGPLCDIQVAEPLLDEERPGGYTLEALSQSYLGQGKSEDLLREAAEQYQIDPKKSMKYLPARYVTEYAADDAENPVHIFMQQEEEMKADGVWDLFTDLEQPLQRVLFKMRLRGVRVDLDAAEILRRDAVGEEIKLYERVYQQAGFRINVDSGPQVARFLEKEGVEVPRTAKDNFSVTGEWLDTLEHPAGKLIKDLRKTIKMRKDFVEGVILNQNVRGRLHSEWSQVRRPKNEDGGGDETKGTRGGRIAASNVNLTQIPSRDPRWGKAIRRCFIADEGCFWGKKDYSQQEPRILLHFAYLMNLRGSHEVRRKYIEDPLTDYHQATADTIKLLTGKELDRRPAKDINLGRAYGMGVDKLARKLGVGRESAQEILRVYDEGVPYVRLLDNECKDRVKERGFIRTLLGRKRRFNRWEKAGSFGYGNTPPTDYETAVRLWGRDNIVRAGLAKVLNALVQGSAGDQTKRAIILMDQEGLTPQIQVYDELNGSYETLEQVERASLIMERAVELSVPMDASPDVGPNWADVKVHNYERKAYFFEREHFLKEAA